MSWDEIYHNQNSERLINPYVTFAYKNALGEYYGIGILQA